jgi:hypothetical protein
MNTQKPKYFRHNKQNKNKIQCRTLNGFECMYLINKINDYFSGKNFIDLPTKQYLIDYVVRNKNTISLDSPKETLKFLLKEGIEKSQSIKNYTKKKIRMRGQSGIKLSKQDAFTQIFLKGGRIDKTKKKTQLMKIIKMNRKKPDSK